MFIVSNPYDDYGTIYGVTETIEDAIKLSYDAHIYDNEGCPWFEPMEFSRWDKFEHWIDWVSEWEFGKSWIYDKNNT